MLNFKKQHFLSFIVLVAFSCNNPSSKNSIEPIVTGSPGELVVFTTTKSGKYFHRLVDSIFAKKVETVFPKEPFYHIIYVDNKKDADAFSQNHRNVLIIGLKSELENLELISGYNLSEAIQDKFFKALTGSNKNVYITLSSSIEDLTNQLISNGEHWVSEIYTTELKTDLPQPFTLKVGTDSINQIFQTKFGFNMPVPSAFGIKKIEDNFAWIFYGGSSLSLNIQVNIYPFNENWSSEENIIKIRNEFGKRFIEGEKEGTWMSTSESGEFIKEYWSVTSTTGDKVVGLNAAWVLLGETMGGPFCRKLFYDKEHARIVAIEGFVSSAPGRRIANLRLLESVLQGFKI